jgi:hypothetical protein
MLDVKKSFSGLFLSLWYGINELIFFFKLSKTPSGGFILLLLYNNNKNKDKNKDKDIKKY